MRVVLDTNILVSALISPAGNPAAIYNVWEDGRFMLLTCEAHLDELRATLQKPRVACWRRQLSPRFTDQRSAGTQPP